MARAALLLQSLVLLLLAAPACPGQTAIRHCVSANGTPVFTDQPCDSMQSLGVGAIPPDGGHHLCPVTRGTLRERVAQAFVRRDANALAGLMLWEGYSDVDAIRELARLKRLMRRPLLDVEDADSATPEKAGQPNPAETMMAPIPSPGPQPDLLVHLGGMQTGPEPPLSFAVEARAGCLWLRP